MSEETSGARESQWGGPKTAFTALIALAAVLRFVGIEHGAPLGNLLDPREQDVVPRAWSILNHAVDPGWFGQPNGLLYLFSPTQLDAGDPNYLRARLLTAALGVATVAATWWLASRAWGTTAGGVAAAIVAVEATHVASSHLATAEVALTLGVAITLALLSSGRLIWGGVAAGISTAFAYAGVLLFVPLIFAARRDRRGLALGVGAGLGAFAITNPFLVLHPLAGAGDIWDRLSTVYGERAFGFEHDHWAGFSFSGTLWDGMALVLPIALLGLVLALIQRRDSADVLLPLFALSYFIFLLPLQDHSAYFVLPLVPVLAALAARVRYLTAVTLLLLVIPLVASVRADQELVRDDTRVVAAGRVAKLLAPGDIVAVDDGLAAPSGFQIVRLRKPAPGSEIQRLLDKREPQRSLLSLAGATVVLVNGRVAHLVLASPSRYPAAAAFYRRIRREPPLLNVISSDKLSGPQVTLYRLSRP